MTSASGVRDALARDRVLAIVRYREGGDLVAALDALAAGGVRVAEVTMDTPGALAAIEARAHHAELVVGAGTVTTTDEVRHVADAGGRFVVSPGFDPEVVEVAHDLRLATLPGVTTATEVLAARRAGVELFKLFPAGALGTSYLTQLLGPFGSESFVPTGGIGLDDVQDWLDAGAFAVALGSALCGRVAPATDGELEALTAAAASVVERATTGEGRG